MLSIQNCEGVNPTGFLRLVSTHDLGGRVQPEIERSCLTCQEDRRCLMGASTDLIEPDLAYGAAALQHRSCFYQQLGWNKIVQKRKSIWLTTASQVLHARNGLYFGSMIWRRHFEVRPITNTFS